jgi:hypothetical protein
MKDKCVICSKETHYDESVHIDYRTGYVEGVGQLCYSCFTGKDNITIHPHTVMSLSNDSELGAFIRKLLWDKMSVSS